MIQNKKVLYLFIHIPRTWGESVVKKIAVSQQDSQILILEDRSDNPKIYREKVKKYLGSLTVGEKEHIEVVAGGGVFYGLHKFFTERDCRYVTFFSRSTDYETFFLDYYSNILGEQITDISNLDFKKIKENLSYFYFLGTDKRPFEDFLFISNILGVTDYTAKEKAPNLSSDFLIENKKEESDELKEQLHKFACQLNNDFKHNNPNFYLQINRIKRRLFLKLICNLFNFKKYPNNLYLLSDFLKQQSSFYNFSLKKLKSILSR